MEQNHPRQANERLPWPGPERRKSKQEKYTGKDRRRKPLDHEEPMDEQEERELAQERGPVNARTPW